MATRKELSKIPSEEESYDVFHELEGCPSAEGLISVSRSRIDSFSSVTSIYSADGGQGPYCVSGRIKVGIWFKNNILFTRVVKAKGLAATKSGGVSDPYVKTYLLPDRTKVTKRKTAIERKTTNPEYDETLKNKLLQSEINLSTLWLSVWDWDKFGRNQFLGEVRFPLSRMDLTDSRDQWYELQDKEQEHKAVPKGKLKVAIKFKPSVGKTKAVQSGGSLVIAVKEATGLPQMDPNGLTDSFVKTYLLPKRTNFAKKKTSTIKGTLDPAWNEELEYKLVSLNDLKTNRVLELSVWDFDRRGCNDFIGCLRLGPSGGSEGKAKKEWMDSTESEVKHWEETLEHPGEWVEYEHDLRPSIESLNKPRQAVPRNSSLRRQKAINPLNPCASSSSVESVDSEDSIRRLKPGGSFDGENYIKGKYEISGRIRVSLEHKKGKLMIHIHNAEELAAADFNGFSDPYVKACLLPDKNKYPRKKTAVKKKTLSPEFNEKMTYNISESKLSSRTLWLSVWDWDRFGKDEFLGEVRISAKLHFSYEWFTLYDRGAAEVITSSPTDAETTSPSASCDDHASPSASCDDHAKLHFRLQFQSTPGQARGVLYVHIVAAENLARLNCNLCYVKLDLLPHETGSKQSSVVSRNASCPTWNEEFVFSELTLDELSAQRALRLALWDSESGRMVGSVHLGPAAMMYQGSFSEGVRLWQAMLAQPGEWVECCLSLQSSGVVHQSDSVEEDSASIVRSGSEKVEDSAVTENSEGGRERAESSEMKNEMRNSFDSAAAARSEYADEKSELEWSDMHAELRRSSDVIGQNTRPMLRRNGMNSQQSSVSEEQDSSEPFRGNIVPQCSGISSPTQSSSVDSTFIHPFI